VRVGDWITDILVFGGALVFFIVAVRDQSNFNNLVGGMANTYVSSVSSLSKLG
jgi:hypothetical protein